MPDLSVNPASLASEHGFLRSADSSSLSAQGKPKVDADTPVLGMEVWMDRRLTRER